jgi:hypothetical protein
MPQVQIITPGEDVSLTEDLYEKGILAVLSSATIRACLQDAHGRQILPWTLQSSSASGADWASGRVVCEFPSTITSSLSRGDAWLAIEVVRSGKIAVWPIIQLEVQGVQLP